MNILEAIDQRRAIKHYDPNHQLTDDETRQLLSAAMKSPTAFNIQHWRFVVVADPGLRKQIRAVAWDQAQVTDASLLIVMCADRKAWEKDAPRYWKNAPQPVQDMLVPAISQYYQNNETVERDECMRSCGIAGQTIMLAAKGMGYDSCPMDGFDFGAVAKLINLPEDHLVAYMIAVGKGVKDAWPRPGQLSYDEVVIQDRF